MPTKTEEAWPINHFSGGKAHGPVRLFVRDDGQAVLVCDVDGTTWKLADLATDQMTAALRTIAQVGASRRRSALKPKRSKATRPKRLPLTNAAAMKLVEAEFKS